MRFGFDEHDQEWETGDGSRTVYVSRLDDDWCEECQDDIVDDRCKCDEEVTA